MVAGLGHLGHGLGALEHGGAGLALGFVISGLSVLFGLTTIVMKMTAQTVPGWATIVVAVSFLGGAQLMVLGVIGEYVNRVYEEVKSRPLFVSQDGSLAERAGHRLRPPVQFGAEPSGNGSHGSHGSRAGRQATPQHLGLAAHRDVPAE